VRGLCGAPFSSFSICLALLRSAGVACGWKGAVDGPHGSVGVRSFDRSIVHTCMADHTPFDTACRRLQLWGQGTESNGALGFSILVEGEHSMPMFLMLQVSSHRGGTIGIPAMCTCSYSYPLHSLSW
jgi:hypothetical protein